MNIPKYIMKKYKTTSDIKVGGKIMVATDLNKNSDKFVVYDGN